MSRRSRELRALERAKDNARRSGMPWYVYLGTPYKAANTGAIHVRSGLTPRLRGGTLVATCSSTGLVRIHGQWVGVVQVAG